MRILFLCARLFARLVVRYFFLCVCEIGVRIVFLFVGEIGVHIFFLFVCEIGVRNFLLFVCEIAVRFVCEIFFIVRAHNVFIASEHFQN